MMIKPIINTKKLDQFEILTLFNFNHNYTSFVSQHINYNINDTTDIFSEQNTS